jgi:hypothetical protein
MAVQSEGSEKGRRNVGGLYKTRIALSGFNRHPHVHSDPSQMEPDKNTCVLNRSQSYRAAVSFN